LCVGESIGAGFEVVRNRRGDQLDHDVGDEDLEQHLHHDSGDEEDLEQELKPNRDGGGWQRC